MKGVGVCGRRSWGGGSYIIVIIKISFSVGRWGLCLYKLVLTGTDRGFGPVWWRSGGTSSLPLLKVKTIKNPIVTQKGDLQMTAALISAGPPPKQAPLFTVCWLFWYKLNRKHIFKTSELKKKERKKGKKAVWALLGPAKVFRTQATLDTRL